MKTKPKDTKMASTINAIANVKEAVEVSIDDGANMWTKSEIAEEVEHETYFSDDFSQIDKDWITKRLVQWVEKKYNTILND